MRALRDTWSELVERRLWPLALLLAAALVAVPVVLAKQPSSDGAAAGSEAAPLAAGGDQRQAGEPVVGLDTGAAPAAPLRGRAKDPFLQQHVPPRAGASGGGTPPTGAPPANGGAGGGGASGGGGSAPPAQRTYVYASIDVRFGRAASPLREILNVPRLTPLPSAADPILIFLGMRADRETAVFMVSTDVHAQGEVRCVPSRKLCEAIELSRGDVALLDVAAADGSVTQYELDLTDVTLHQTTSQAQASRAYARSSRAGRRLVRRAAATSAVASALRYSPQTGVLAPLDGTYLERDGAPAADGGGPQASAGAIQRAPVLTPLP